MKETLIKLLKTVGLYKTYQVPSFVSARYTEMDENAREDWDQSMEDFCKPENYETEENRRRDMHALSIGRLRQFRSTHVPFLVESIGLEGKKVLEIGCGTGSSSVAMAEQGAILTGIDVDADALEIARKRMKNYRQEGNLLHLNADSIDQLDTQDFDVVIFFASIEHMTPQERQVALKKAFSVLKSGGHMCILGTPNRLWPVDIHTSYIPFYMWLQDDLAFDYARFSSRTEFQQIHKGSLKDNFESFYRWGRGVSFHEIELALDSQAPIKVVSALPIYLRRHSFIQRISYKRSHEYKYKQALMHYGPKNVHPGFYECYLDVIVEKS